MLYVVGLAFVLSVVAAAPNSCPAPEPMANFDFNKYATGRWFEVGRYDNGIEKGADCVMFDYSSEGGKATCTAKEVVNKTPKTQTWTVSPAPDAGTTGKLFYSFLRNVGENVNVLVLDTDYDNYSIFYYCYVDDATKTPKEVAWVKSRTPTMTPETKDKVEKFVKAHPYVDETRMFWDKFTHADCLIDV